jgi:uncharacterized protein (TIGR03435 family)
MSIDLEGDGTRVSVLGKFASMDYFAWRLSQVIDRPVINRTQLGGNYDFNLSFTREPPRGGPNKDNPDEAPAENTGPSVFDAIRDQMGLRLEPQKGPVEVMVIDHAEKPIEN